MSRPECPLVDEFLHYLTVVQNRSAQTVEAYGREVLYFLRYFLARSDGIRTPGDEELASVSLDRITPALLREVERRDIVEYLAWTVSAHGTSGATRKRKLAAIRTFFRYHTVVSRICEHNPAADVDTPTLPKKLPRYLNEEESVELLKAVLSDETSRFMIRDYAILTLFLNCGMRVSELVGLDLGDLEADLSSLRVMGKGAKERIIYLNHACREALGLYLAKRDPDGQVKPEHRKALFLSSLHRRISKIGVQVMVYKYLDRAGLSDKQCSVHKLRHTAATLMYRSGQVDIRVLKDILGHEQLSTTQIYTHISNEAMQAAMEQNPLAALEPGQIKRP